MNTRRLHEDEAEAAADVYLAARALMTYIPQLPAFEPGPVKNYFRDILFKTSSVYGVNADGRLVAILALHDGWIEQLYVMPNYTGRGFGAALLDFAKAMSPAGLQLWALEANEGAIRFYKREGFSTAERTSGEHAMEKIPDRRMIWRP